MYAIKLEEITFDTMENRDAIRIKELGLFVADDKDTAEYKVSNYLQAMPPQQMYAGWDGEVYPKYKMTKVNLF